MLVFPTATPWGDVIAGCAEAATSERIVFAELPAVQSLARVPELLDELDDADVAGARLLRHDGVTLESAGGGFSSLRYAFALESGTIATTLSPERRQVLWVDRRAFAARRDALLATGPPHWSAGDTLAEADWGWRLSLTGHRVIGSPILIPIDEGVGAAATRVGARGGRPAGARGHRAPGHDARRLGAPPCARAEPGGGRDAEPRDVGHRQAARRVGHGQEAAPGRGGRARIPGALGTTRHRRPVRRARACRATSGRADSPHPYRCRACQGARHRLRHRPPERGRAHRGAPPWSQSDRASRFSAPTSWATASPARRSAPSRAHAC